MTTNKFKKFMKGVCLSGDRDFINNIHKVKYLYCDWCALCELACSIVHKCLPKVQEMWASTNEMSRRFEAHTYLCGYEYKVKSCGRRRYTVNLIQKTSLYRE